MAPSAYIRSGCATLGSESYLLLSSDAFLSVLAADPFTRMKVLALLVLVAVSAFLVSGRK